MKTLYCAAIYGLAFMAAVSAILLGAALPANAGSLDAFAAALNPHMPSIVELIVVPFILGVAIKGARKLGVDIEASHRETLHSALLTAARLAVAKQLTGAAAVGLILDYVRRSAPDALSKLKPGMDVLQDLAKSKLAVALDEAKSGDALSDSLAKAIAIGEKHRDTNSLTSQTASVGKVWG